MKGMLSTGTLLEIVRGSFGKVRDRGQRVRSISLQDTLMSGFAVFCLKYSSLLQFDKGRLEEQTRHNLRGIYGTHETPCDTQMREPLP